MEARRDETRQDEARRDKTKRDETRQGETRRARCSLPSPAFSCDATDGGAEGRDSRCKPSPLVCSSVSLLSPCLYLPSTMLKSMSLSPFFLLPCSSVSLLSPCRYLPSLLVSLPLISLLSSSLPVCLSPLSLLPSSLPVCLSLLSLSVSISLLPCSSVCL